MRYLLDTHAVLWTLFEPENLSTSARRAIENTENEIVISVLSFWEISLKYSLGKLKLTGTEPEKLPVLAEKSGFNIAPLDAKILSTYHKLPRGEHKDPFDRMLVWFCIQEDLFLISKDGKLKAEYKASGLRCFW